MIVQNKHNIKIKTPSGWQTFSGIQKKKALAVKISFNQCQSIDATLNHRFFYKKQEIFVKDLKIGNKLDHQSLNTVTIQNIENIGEIDVYDLLDVNGHIYYTNGLVSHNCIFLGSTATVIDSVSLQRLFDKERVFPITTDFNGSLRVYEKPQDGVTYIIGVDVGRGTGNHDSTIQVLKVISAEPIKLKQVAAYNNNRTDVYKFSELVYRAALLYNDAHLLVENNADGAAVVSTIWWDYEYMNLYNSGKKTSDLGIRATRGTKPKAVMLMKKLIENESVEIVDKETLLQLSTFVEEDGKLFGKDNPDDLVSGLYWALYAIDLNLIDDIQLIKKPDPEDEAWGILGDVDLNKVDIFADEGFGVY